MLKSTISRRALMAGAAVLPMAAVPAALAADPMPPGDVHLQRLERLCERANAEELRYLHEVFGPAGAAWVDAKRDGKPTAAQEAQWRPIQARYEQLADRRLYLEHEIASAAAAGIEGMAVKARQILRLRDHLGNDVIGTTAESLAEHVATLSVAVAGIAGTTLAATPGRDPIFAAIAAHREAYEKHEAAVSEQWRLEPEIPESRRRSRVIGEKQIIHEDDDPRWIAALRRTETCCRADDEAAWELLHNAPTTKAGARALRDYVENTLDHLAAPEGLAEVLWQIAERRLAS
jgi:hypothetical protein